MPPLPLLAAALLAAPLPAPSADTLGVHAYTIYGPPTSTTVLAAARTAARPHRAHLAGLAPAVSGALGRLYRRSRRNGREAVRCLIGTRAPDGGTRVTGLARPRVHEAAAASVRYDAAGCRRQPGFVGIAHTHPALGGPPVCDPSPQDVAAFRADREARVAVLVCGERDLVWMRRADRWLVSPAAALERQSRPRRLPAVALYRVRLTGPDRRPAP